jgi:tRNA (guanine37-N1)-methyltransferase
MCRFEIHYICAKNYAMRIDILTLFPEMFEGPFSESIIKRAQEKGLVEIYCHNIRDYSTNKHKKVDDYAFSGGAGMVMQIEPIARVIEKLKGEREYDEIIYVTPDGETFNQGIANQLSLKGNIMILCGHYKGVDQRVRDHFITREISIGDFVLTGGELAAAVISDAVIRLIPGVISDETSALTDSFQDNLLAPPVYTRPADFRGWKVPDILLSGDVKKIEAWKEQQAYRRTKERRPDLLK